MVPLKNSLWIPLSFIGMFLSVVFLRPLLPIDETRYVSVAWEMLLRHDWLAPLTINGQPYHHKPPLLFWLINSVWLVTGPTRWAATIPPFLAGLATIILTGKLAQSLYKDDDTAQRSQIIMAGSLAFLIYSSMVMFDVTVAAFTLATLIVFIKFSETGRWYYLPLAGLLLGLGVLTKGPVTYLYIIFPVLMGPIWHKKPVTRLSWYGGFLIAVLCSTIPVLLWLVPVLQQSDDHFAFWLVWEQTAGRITGNFNDAHVRPFWFYLPIVPALLVPWIFVPRFWKGLPALNVSLKTEKPLKFLMCWIIPVFISFSLISGKQPHYLVPLVPGMTIFTARLLRDIRLITMQKIALTMVFTFMIAHIIGSQTIFKEYKLEPVAAFIQQHSDNDWGFVKKYHGEVTFLARMEKSLDVLEEPGELEAWIATHPDGYFIMRYKNPEDVAAYHQVLSLPYRQKTLGIFETSHH